MKSFQRIIGFVLLGMLLGFGFSSFITFIIGLFIAFAGIMTIYSMIVHKYPAKQIILAVVIIVFTLILIPSSIRYWLELPKWSWGVFLILGGITLITQNLKLNKD